MNGFILIFLSGKALLIAGLGGRLAGGIFSELAITIATKRHNSGRAHNTKENNNGTHHQVWRSCSGHLNMLITLASVRSCESV